MKIQTVNSTIENPKLCFIKLKKLHVFDIMPSYSEKIWPEYIYLIT